MVSATVLVNLFLASVVLGDSSLKRHAASTQFNNAEYLETPVKGAVSFERMKTGNRTQAGAIYHGAEGTISGISARFTIPTAIGPAADGPGVGSAGAWVGIDGDTCNNSLATGVDFNYSQDRLVTLSAWWKWSGAAQKVDVAFKPGHTVLVTLTLTSPTSGRVFIMNQSTGFGANITASSPDALCGQDALWVVKPLNVLAQDLANFTTVVFSDAVASTRNGHFIFPTDANTTDYLGYGGNLLTTTTVDTFGLTVTYVGYHNVNHQ